MALPTAVAVGHSSKHHVCNFVLFAVALLSSLYVCERIWSLQQENRRLVEKLLEGSGAQQDGSWLGSQAGWQTLRAFSAAARSAAASGAAQVVVYVDGRYAASGAANETRTLPAIHRACVSSEEDTLVDAGGAVLQSAAGFSVPLPALAEGRHQVEVFAVLPPSAEAGPGARSSLARLENGRVALVVARSAPAVQIVLDKKNAIINMRNHQIVELQSQLSAKAAWAAAAALRADCSTTDDAQPQVLAAAGSQGLPDSAGSAAAVGQGERPALLAVVAVVSALRDRARRDMLRRTWFPADRGAAAQLRERLGVEAWFVVALTDTPDEPAEHLLEEEASQHSDILRLRVRANFDNGGRVAADLLRGLRQRRRADFYFKAADTIVLSLPRLAAYLQPLRGKTNLYMGCMKSSTVVTDSRSKWYEPEAWRFGTPGAKDGLQSYVQHAAAQLYGVSEGLAAYVAANHRMLHTYRFEDVTVGAWMLGLEVEMQHDGNLCCSSVAACGSSAASCVAAWDLSCQGVCKLEQNLERLWKTCIATS